MNRRIARWLGCSVFLAVLFVSPQLHAGIISADFNETLDLPDYRPNGPRILERLNVALPAPGPQLTELDEVSNPSGWGDSLLVDFDATTNILSLTPTNFNDYQTITITLSNLVLTGGQTVIGIVPITLNSAVIPEFGPLTQSQSFTANSFSVSYTSFTNPFDTLQFVDGGVDTYQIILSRATAAPEPGTLLSAALAAAFGLIQLRRRAR